MTGQSTLLVALALCAFATALPGRPYGGAGVDGVGGLGGVGVGGGHLGGLGGVGVGGGHLGGAGGVAGLGGIDGALGTGVVGVGVGGSSFNPAHFPDLVPGFPFHQSHPGQGFGGCKYWCRSSYQNNYYCCTRSTYAG
ncbi:acanthoscurrin-1-like [Macrobrachium nipponense]|uniref:acanthoscurrin-1-like n=1 Tax=Macrobrachium nipponense TaxID=159736 RepID=UPI0030C8C624